MVSLSAPRSTSCSTGRNMPCSSAVHFEVTYGAYVLSPLKTHARRSRGEAYISTARSDTLTYGLFLFILAEE